MALTIYVLYAYYLLPNYGNNLLIGEHKKQINEYLLKHLNSNSEKEWNGLNIKSGLLIRFYFLRVLVIVF